MIPENKFFPTDTKHLSLSNHADILVRFQAFCPGRCRSTFRYSRPPTTAAAISASGKVTQMPFNPAMRTMMGARIGMTVICRSREMVREYFVAGEVGLNGKVQPVSYTHLTLPTT